MGERSRPLLVLSAAVLAAVSACGLEAGRATPTSGLGSVPTSVPTSAPTSVPPTVAGGGAVSSVEDLDLCALLEPKDFPVVAAPGDVPLRSDDPVTGCLWTISIDGRGATFTAGVAARAIPFTRFVPPPQSPNGRGVEIGGRPAWLGNPLSDVEKGCTAAFGSADGLLTVSITDGTGRGVDPCETTAGLAELVVSRTPPPTG